LDSRHIPNDLICRQRDHTVGVGSPARGPGQSREFRAHDRRRDVYGEMVRARGMDKHGLTGRFAQECQRVVVDRQPAQTAAPQGLAPGAGSEKGARVR
jgi:hypothetical protein